MRSKKYFNTTILYHDQQIDHTKSIMDGCFHNLNEIQDGIHKSFLIILFKRNFVRKAMRKFLSFFYD